MNARSPVSRGFTAGLVGAAVFAAWFLLVDLLKSQPFFTPAYMSGLVFSGTTALPATARVAVFTLLHFLAFGAVGVLVSLLLDVTKFAPRVYIGIALGFLLFDIVFYGSVLGLGVDVVRALGWPQVLIGNMLAGTAILAFMLARSG